MGPCLIPRTSQKPAIPADAADQAAQTEPEYPLIAVEHQGVGHSQGNADERDRIKRLALERAGIGLIETYDDDDHAAIFTALKEELVRVRNG